MDPDNERSTVCTPHSRSVSTVGTAGGERANGSRRKRLTRKKSRRCRRPRNASAPRDVLSPYGHCVMAAASVHRALGIKSRQPHWSYLLIRALFQIRAPQPKNTHSADRLMSCNHD